MCIPILCFVCVCVHPAGVHVGEPGLGVGGQKGGARAPSAARTSGRGQCGLRGSGHGGDVHLPLAAGALRLPVRPAGLVQHRGGLRQRTQRALAAKQTAGKSAVR